MSIPVISVVKNPAGGWIFTWSDLSAAFYRVVLWGIQLSKQTSLTYTWNGQEYRTVPPPLEIAFEDQEVLSEKYSPLFVIQWHGTPTAFQYIVEQYNIDTALWVAVARIQETGLEVYQFLGAVVADQTTTQYRVLAVNRVGQASAPLNFSKYSVCPPKPPDSDILIGYTGSQISILPL